jgi:4-amino-4-deoxy-L-arabinose transferase-like glycosyltransferase
MPLDKRMRAIFLIILAVSVLLRVGSAFFMGNTVTDMPGTADQLSYHNLALRVLDGHGLTFGEPWWPATRAGEPTAHWSYLYTGYLVGVYALFGPNPLAARLIQAVIVGLLQPVLVYLLGRRLFGSAAGLAAAALTAVYIYFFYYAGALMTEPFYINAILASLLLAIRLVDRAQIERPGWDLGLGLTLGATLLIAILLRQLFMLIVPFLFGWVLLAGWKRMPALILAGMVIVVGILPFTAYNYARFQSFVLLNTNAGYAFFWGNHPIHGERFIPILPGEMGSYYSLLPPELLHLNEAELDQALLKRGLQFIADDPGRYVLLSLSRIPPYFMFWPSADSGFISNLSRVGSFGIMWPFMLYGLIRALRAGKQAVRLRPPAPVTLVYLFLLLYTGIHILTWTLIRYRLPVDAVLLAFAGLALLDLFLRIPVLKRWSNGLLEMRRESML